LRTTQPHLLHEFQFPLHRDPRCNNKLHRRWSLSCLVSVPFTSGSSLQHFEGIFGRETRIVSVPFTSGSSLQHKLAGLPVSKAYVSVPFTSGSSLQPGPLASSCLPWPVSVPFTSGSSLQHGSTTTYGSCTMFQFPLHRDPRCNTVQISFMDMYLSMFQFPLHRDPRCNADVRLLTFGASRFQFPLHRDPRCNQKGKPVTWSMFCFSSLYIGILAATWSNLYSSKLQ